LQSTPQSPEAAVPETGWIAAYRPLPGVFDEMSAPEGGVRPHWENFAAALEGLGPAEMLRRWEQARRLIIENGVTYNVHGDPRGLDRPWSFDPIPLLFAPAEWAALEAALIQRARLLEVVLEDLYGPQNLLAEGLLPAELVFAHPGFLRPCHGVRVPGGRRLHLYAADLGRGSDGQLRVYGDRTQAPSGAGYAVENRIVLSRSWPDVYRDTRVHRLAPFFRTLRDTLRAAAPRRRDDPRVVLLTPGPYNETYFEHAYLARYLGFTLAEGGDLTVRDDAVFLKLLGGLQPVDVIVRRLDDDFCDPLELRPDSFLGVPGLVQAVRAGNVAVANSLGSGLVETPALSGFLPDLCRHLFGEELRLPAVPTWWCGDPENCRYVLANLHRLVVKPTFPSLRMEPVFGAALSARQRQDLADRIRARPRDYTAQEQMQLSTAPVQIEGRLVPRQTALRVYLCAADDGFAVMPGGLGRVAGSADNPVVSIVRGGGSKDAWVLSEGPVQFVSLLAHPGRPVEITRGGDDLPSRVADNMFWLGRYLERTEGMVRLVRGILARPADVVGPAEQAALMSALTRSGRMAAPPVPAVATERELLGLIYDEASPHSLAGTLASLQRVTRSVRDRLSADAWRLLHGLSLKPEPPGASANGKPDDRDAAEKSGPAEKPLPPERRSPPSGPVAALRAQSSTFRLAETLNRLIAGLSGFTGLLMESTTRGQGWRFLDMGRRLERALAMVNLLGATVAEPPAGADDPAPPLEAALEVADSIMTYRRRYLAGPQPAAVLDLLILDESNPRSVAFQLAQLSEHLERLPQERGRVLRSPEQRLLLGLWTAVRLADPEDLARADGAGRRATLQALLSRCITDLPALSDALTRRYLSHVVPSRQLPGARSERLP
jgi:uncharacterized circularly permuted ATP-grasp superfamily protein/uncharacterized alpha-E superfamily protein